MHPGRRSAMVGDGAGIGYIASTHGFDCPYILYIRSDFAHSVLPHGRFSQCYSAAGPGYQCGVIAAVRVCARVVTHGANVPQWACTFQVCGTLPTLSGAERNMIRCDLFFFN